VLSVSSLQGTPCCCPQLKFADYSYSYADQDNKVEKFNLSKWQKFGKKNIKHMHIKISFPVEGIKLFNSMPQPCPELETS